MVDAVAIDLHDGIAVVTQLAVMHHRWTWPVGPMGWALLLSPTNSWRLHFLDSMTVAAAIDRELTHGVIVAADGTAIAIAAAACKCYRFPTSSAVPPTDDGADDGAACNCCNAAEFRRAARNAISPRNVCRTI